MTLQPGRDVIFITDGLGKGEAGDLSTGNYPALAGLLNIFLGKIDAWEPIVLPDGIAG